MTKKRVFLAIGTRPEAIKMAPLVHELARESSPFRPSIVATGQHKELVRSVFEEFSLEPQFDLELMRPAQGLADFGSLCLSSMDKLLAAEKPDCLLVQGDTSSAVMSAWAAFFRGVPVGHVEAGLRTGDPRLPFPEEMNRRLLARLATWHFAPTHRAANNLRAEGVDPRSTFVVGNTGIDALQLALAFPKSRASSGPTTALDEFLARVPESGRVLLVTMHRRENFGDPLRRILEAVAAAVEEDARFHVVFPVHPNPAVREAVSEVLRPHRRVFLGEPVEYPVLVRLMGRAWAIVTDSGGIQEEAPTLGKPVLVLRESTERQEAVECGSAVLVGSDGGKIGEWLRRLAAEGSPAYAAMAQVRFPFGDGFASRRIVELLARSLRLGAGEARTPSPKAMKPRRDPKRWRDDAKAVMVPVGAP